MSSHAFGRNVACQTIGQIDVKGDEEVHGKEGSKGFGGIDVRLDQPPKDLAKDVNDGIYTLGIHVRNESYLEKLLKLASEKGVVLLNESVEWKKITDGMSE